MISLTRNHVIIDKPSYLELRTRAIRGERLLDELRREKSELDALLNAALHELGLERGVKDPQYFVRRWRRERRSDQRRG